MNNVNLWNQLLVWPITNTLVAFYKLFEYLHVPGPLGFAVIGMTISMRILLFPLVMAQLRSAKKMQALKPKLDAIAAKHKDDKTAQQQAQMQLYKDEGINPAAGCLPSLVQLPVLIALYNVFSSILGATGGAPAANGAVDMTTLLGQINSILYHPALSIQKFDETFFGLSLGTLPSQWQTVGWWLLLIPVVTAGLQWYQTKMMLPPAKTQAQISPSDKKIKKTDTKDTPPEDMAMEMQKQMAIISPLMFGYFAFNFPIGLALYWNIFGLFGMMQQLLVNKEHEDSENKKQLVEKA